MASAMVVVVATALVLPTRAANAQKPITLAHAKTVRNDTTRADTTRADSLRARKARADTIVVARPDSVRAARTDTARVQSDTTANDTTGVSRTTVSDTMHADSVRADTTVTDTARADTTVVVPADSAAPDSARMETGPMVRDSNDLGTADAARTEPVVVVAPDAVRTSLVARPKKSEPTFSEKHQNYERVLSAKVEKRFELKQLFRERGMSFPADEVLLRVFKRERALEVWVRTNGQAEFTMLKSYRICALGTLVGPKRVRGDGQTPEGFYYIDTFNPSSGFHLSLRVDYPNRADRIRSQGKELGGDIYIHGGCKTLGCLAVTDDGIKELYWLAVEARNAGQRIPVHIFPTKLTDEALHHLVTVFHKQPDLQRFWANLKPTYDYFEANHRLPAISIDDHGWYRIKALEAPVAEAEPTHAKLKN